MHILSSFPSRIMGVLLRSLIIILKYQDKLRHPRAFCIFPSEAGDPTCPPNSVFSSWSILMLFWNHLSVVSVFFSLQVSQTCFHYKQNPTRLYYFRNKSICSWSGQSFQASEENSWNTPKMVMTVSCFVKLMSKEGAALMSFFSLLLILAKIHGWFWASEPVLLHFPFQSRKKKPKASKAPGSVEGIRI